MSRFERGATGSDGRYRMRRLCVAGVGLALLAAAARADSPPASLENMPGAVNYQATLKQADGTDYINGVYTIEFRLYPASSGGAVLWGAQYSVYVKDGQFGVMLGSAGGQSVSPAPTYGPTELWKAVWHNDASPENDLYLGMKVQPAENESVPRQQFLCAPFAFRAHQALYAAKSAVGFTVGGALLVSSNATVNGNLGATAVSGFGTIPLGGIIMWSGNEADVPTGWALCKGGTTNNLTIPDLRGRFVLASGQGAGLSNREPKALGGAETVTLSVNQMPTHAHSVDPPALTTPSTGDHTHTYTTGDQSTGVGDGERNGSEIGRIIKTEATSSTGAHQHVIDLPAVASANTGSGQAHENMPPFFVLAFIMRVQ